MAKVDAMAENRMGASANRAMQNRRLNVLYLNHASQISGAEQSLRALLWQLRRSDSAVDPVVALPGGGPLADLLRSEEWSVTFVPLRRLQRPHNLIGGLSTLVHVLQTAPFIAKLADRMGAELLHSNSTTAHLVGGLAADRLKKPAIWHARDLIRLPRIAPQMAERAAAIIAISGCVAEQLQRDGVPPEKIRIITNGLDPDEWQPQLPGSARHALRQTLSIADDAFVFGCVGQLVPWKKHIDFIEAAAQLCDDAGCAQARFVLLGGDLWGEHQGYVQQLRERVKALGLAERFNFVPHQLDNVGAMSTLDAIVLAARDEPFGRVLIEGMALSKPVIAFAQNGPLEIITHEHDGLLVSPDEPDGLAHAMRRVLQDGELRDWLSRHARQTVVQRFHIADHAQKVLDLYHEVLG